MGPFDLKEPVAKGGMGEIWAAVHRSQGVPAAVKVLTVSRATDYGFRSAFRKEVRAVARLDHPNVVVVFDHGEVTDEAAADSAGKLVARSPYLAMEFVSGGSLGDWRGKMPWVHAKKTLLALLSALAHAHSRGVIHRDIKPGNVLLLQDGTIRLTDFGLAHAMARGEEDPSETARRGGTPAYMAPEQLQGAWRDFGPWTDLYAVGCLTWTLVTGRPPFGGKNWLEVMQAHLAVDPPPLNPKMPVPDELEDWLRKLLAKHPSQRFRRAADAAWALLRLPDECDDVSVDAPATADPEGGSGHRTTLFWSNDEIPEPEGPITLVPEAGPRVTFERPPIPSDWRRLELGRTRLLHGAGLGLYGLRSTGLVGRDSERDQLWSRLRTVEQDRQVHCVWIHGPVGSGKSQLARWLCERAHEVGAAQILIAAHGADAAPSSGIRRMVTHALQTSGMAAESVEERVRDLLAQEGVLDEYEWSALTELVAPRSRDRSVRLASPRERYLLLTRWIARMCSERPVVLWLDDVHWGTDAMGLAEHLVGQDLPVLLLMTSRDDAPRNAIQGRLRRLMSRPRTAAMPVDQLEPVHASELVRDLLGLRGELADQVEKRAAGNPLFAVQLVGDWVRRGLLVPAERGFKLVPGAKVHLPDDLHDVWSAALMPVLEKSSAGARVTLELAATLGQRQDRAEWRRLCKVGRAPAPEQVVDLAIEAGLMRPTSTGWKFVHSMLRESLERTAREGKRWERYNRACVQMLRDLYPGDPEAISGRLGNHLLQSGDAGEATELLLRGVRRHLDASEYREALELLDRRDRALETLEVDSGNARRVEGWLLRATAYLQQGRPHLADAWAERAVEQTANGDPHLHARALARLADVYHHRGDSDQAERRYLAALKQFREEKDWTNIGDCLFGLGRVADVRGRFDRARELLEEARAAYACVQAPLQTARCIDGLARAYRKMGVLDKASAHAEEALARYEALGSASGVATALRRMAVIDTIRRNFDRSDERLRRALMLYERIGDPLGQSYCLNSLAEGARFRGDLEQAEVGYRRALEIGEAIGTRDRLIPQLNLALVVLRQRRFEEARILLEDAAEALEEDGSQALLGGTHVALIACAAAVGEISSVELHFNLARKLSIETGMIDPDAAWPAELAAELLEADGERHWAAACYEVALNHWRALDRTEDVDRVKGHLRRLRS